METSAERQHDGVRVLELAVHQEVRQSVNSWIRTSGRFDAVIDLDAALRDPESPNRLLAEAESLLIARGVVNKGDLIVLTIGEPIGTAGGTNTLKIVRVGEHQII